jgi:hypothetical protein
MKQTVRRGDIGGKYRNRSHEPGMLAPYPSPIAQASPAYPASELSASPCPPPKPHEFWEPSFAVGEPVSDKESTERKSLTGVRLPGLGGPMKTTRVCQVTYQIMDEVSHL